jgi:hypothetical protein
MGTSIFFLLNSYSNTDHVKVYVSNYARNVKHLISKHAGRVVVDVLDQIMHACVG